MAKNKDYEDEVDENPSEEEIEEAEKESDESDSVNAESEVLEKTEINLKDLDENRIIGTEISNEMKRAYIDYAMSVIVSRALPSAEDGLKPVHRRILWAMKQMGLEKGATKKSARIVGECFIKGTEVLTSKGLIPIEKIKHGDNVYTHKGLNEVVELYEMPEKELINLTLMNGNTITVTSEQMIKVIDKDLNYKWKKAKEMDNGDYVVLKCDYPENIETLKLKVINNKFIELNENIAYLLGLYISEGWIEKRYDRICFGTCSIEIAEKIKEILLCEFNYLASIETREKSYNSKNGSLVLSQIFFIRLNNKIICNFLSDTFELQGKKAFDKEIPYQIMQSPKSIIFSFLSGLIEGDGYISKKRNLIVYTSVSEKLIDNLLVLTQHLGIISNKYMQDIKKENMFNNRIIKSNYPTFTLEFHGIFAKNLAAKLKLCDKEKQEKLIKLLEKNNSNSKYEIIPYSGKIIFSEFSNKHLGGGWYENLSGKKFRLGIKYKNGSKIRYSKDLTEKDLRLSQIIEWNILDKLRKINSKYYEQILEIINNKLFFIKIKTITKSKAEKTYDLEVKNDHEFVANGILSHNCMGKYHPHGDMAIYDAMVRMAQDFSLRYPLVHGQGSFGSMDGDGAAAQRYTEAKLEPLAVDLLQDIEKDTVNMIPNFDNSEKEPQVLPGKVPNLLINGSSGIAVGMTTNIPPHNLSEVCDGIIKQIDKPDINNQELMEIIRGPDFPTGGQIVGNTLKELYEKGKAGFVVRGKVTTETKKEREYIIITEIPYQVNKSELVKQIAELVRDKKLMDVSDIRDESKGLDEIRIVIEMKKGANAQFAINRLYKSTKLQTKFDAVMVALVAGVPKTLDLKGFIQVHIDFRRKVIRKRTDFDLKKAEDREHIVKGLLIALKNLDEVIETIKKSREDALDNLMKKFGFTKKQAEAILETKLRQLTAMEHDKLKNEEKDLLEFIDKCRKILGDEKEILKIIKKELNDLKEKYGDNRRSKIIRSVKEIEEKDLVQQKEVIITITDKGYIKRMPYKAYNEQRRGGKGVIGAELTSEDFVKQLISCSTHDYLLLFTARGRMFWLKAYKVPETQRYGKGQAIINLLNIKDDVITNVIAVKEFKDYLFMVTKLGQVKKIRMEMFAKPRNSGIRIINLPLDNSDSVVDVKIIKDKQEVMLFTKEGQGIRFNSEEVRDMGRASYGVTGIKLDGKDIVVSMEIATEQKSTILTVTELGYGKRSLVEDYRLTGRACKGVINLNVTDKTGNVVSTIEVSDKDKFVVSTKKGVVIRTGVKDIRIMGRATQGVRVIKLQEGDRVVDIAKLSDETEVLEGDPENGQKGLSEFENKFGKDSYF